MSADGTDAFETIAARGRTEIPKIKGSRFIGDAFPVQTAAAAKACLSEIRAEFPDATHHCSAFSLDAGGVERSSDDGEPSGTAGPPILRQINSSGLIDVLVVVTRYYGGTKLGAGGLIRAYGQAARACLDNCTRTSRIRETPISIRFGYDDTAATMRTIERFSGRVLDSHYDERSTLTVAVPMSQAEAFSEAFIDAVAGRGTIL